MPLYEYECPKDGTFEKIQKFSDPPLDVCPKCGGPVEKLLSHPVRSWRRQLPWEAAPELVLQKQALLWASRAKRVTSCRCR